MRIVTDGKACTEKAVLALGMFDGVHIGHQVLLKRARVLADRSKAPLVVCTFTGHPLEKIAPDRCPPALTTFDERSKLLEAAGVDLLLASPFTEEMRQMPPENYVGELVRRFHPVDVVCGYNHTFGKGGSGTSAFLAALGDALGFRTQIIPQVTLDGEEVSSSKIREALAAGDAAKAARLLGRPYSYSGTVTACEDSLFFEAAAGRKQRLPEGACRCLITCADGSVKPAIARLAEGDRWQLESRIPLTEGNAQLAILRRLAK